MRRTALAVALASLPATPLFSQGPASEAAFLESLRAAPAAAALRTLARVQADDRTQRRLSAYLDWYGLMERQPSVAAAEMARLTAEGLRSGAYTGLILGESHGVDAEDAAGRAIVGAVLDAGVPVGAFLREENLYPHTEPLDARRVPVLTYRNQFAPEEDVKAGLKAAGHGLLVSYTGCAHTAARIKDYFLYTLEEGKVWHYDRVHRDMPTVEDSFRKHRKKPLIVAMSAEETILPKIEQLLLKALVGDGTDRVGLSAGLDLALAAWTRQMAAYPERTAIAFARSPDQPELYAGLTPSPRRAYELEAVRRALDAPELAAWLGTGRIKSVESLRSSSFTPPDTVEIRYDVIVHAASGGQFKRAVPQTELSAPPRLP